MVAKRPTASKLPASIFVLRIDLARIKPAVLRRLEVGADITLKQLHYLIQMAFDWTDSHLHAFEIDGQVYRVPVPDLFEIDDFNTDDLDASKFRLADLAGVGSRFTYTYDFGDNWVHVVKVEKVLAPAPGVRYPRCTAGKNAAPPEDCGGPWGYAEMLRALADPDHPERDEFLDWIGQDFDPKAFDIDELNAGLDALKA